MFVCFDGQTICLSIIKGFHNLIIKDFKTFFSPFYGSNIKYKSVVSTNEHNRPTKERPKENLDYDTFL